MNRKTTTLATLFAAGAFVAAHAAPVLGATPVKSSHDTNVTEVGCGGDKATDEKKTEKDAKCGKGKKEAKGKKDGKCSGDKKKGEKDASCGKGSCGSDKKKG